MRGTAFAVPLIGVPPWPGCQRSVPSLSVGPGIMNACVLLV